MGRRLALLIATYQYQDDGFGQLTAPAHDAESLAEVLQDPRIAGFDVTTLINEPHYRVGEAIGDFYRDRRRDDLTLLYFTGHGLKDDDGRLYLAMTNTRRDSLLFTSLPAEQIDQAMSACTSQQKVLILDCCYSGAYPAGRITKGDDSVQTLERFQGRGRTVLTASDSTQYSFEGNKISGETAQSVFTRYLVEGLREGTADLDEDGDITLDELYNYVHDRVVEEMPQQRPKRLDNVDGRTLIARNVNWSLPLRLRNLIESPVTEDRVAALNRLAQLHKAGSDIVRSTAFEQIRRLADDDSKAVSLAATERLAAIGTEPVPAAPPTPKPTAPVRPTPGPQPAVVTPWWRRRPTIVVAVLLLAAGGVLVPRLLPTTTTSVAVGPTWTYQNLPLGGIAESRDGRRVYVANFTTNTVSVIDPARNTVIGRPILVGRRPAGMAVTADGRHVYVANSDDSTVSVIDTVSGATSLIAVPRGPFGVTAVLDRPYVYVTSFDARTVTVLDADTGRVVRSPIPVLGHPLGVAVHPQGHRAYVVDDTGTLSVINTATNKITTVAVGDFPYGVTASPEGVDVYVTTLRTNSLVTVDTTTNRTIGPAAALPGGPFGLAAGPGRIGYVTSFDANSVVTVDTVTGRLVGSPVHLPISPRGVLVVDRDAHRLYVTDGAGTVSVVDTRIGTTVGDPIVLPG